MSQSNKCEWLVSVLCDFCMHKAIQCMHKAIHSDSSKSGWKFHHWHNDFQPTRATHHASFNGDAFTPRGSDCGVGDNWISGRSSVQDMAGRREQGSWVQTRHNTSIFCSFVKNNQSARRCCNHDPVHIQQSIVWDRTLTFPRQCTLPAAFSSDQQCTMHQPRFLQTHHKWETLRTILKGCTWTNIWTESAWMHHHTSADQSTSEVVVAS